MRIARYAAVVLAALILTSSAAQAQVDILYNPVNGNLSLESPARSVASFEALSAGNLFIPGNVAPGILAHPFDLITPAKLAKLSVGAGAYNSIDFGNVLPSGLREADLKVDMTFLGSLTPDGSGNNALDAGGLDVVMSFSDDDGLLDVMELPGFPDPDFWLHRVEDLDGLGMITMAGWDDLEGFNIQGKNLNIERGDFEAFPHIGYLTLGTILLDEVWCDMEGFEVCEPLYFPSSISKIQPGSFQGLSNLEYLHLAGAEIEILERGVFAGLPKLERLRLESNGVEKIESGVFDGLHNLKVLELWDNPISKIEVGAFAGLNKLMALKFSDWAMVTDAAPVAIANFSQASFAGLREAFFSEYVPLAREYEWAPVPLDEHKTNLPESDVLILNDATLSGADREDCHERHKNWGWGWGDACYFGLDDIFSDVNPVSASLVGIRIARLMPALLLAGAKRLDHLTVDEHLYDSFTEELDAFAAEEGNTLTIIGYGDANADGFFNSSDLVQVFQAGEYEDGIDNNSYWSTGDWYQDGEFNSADIVYAFQLGQYEVEAAVVAVPEPSAMVLLLLGLIALSRSRARIR